jgi:hypothetical protein
MLSDQGMSDMYSALAFQALRCVASCVECELLCTTAQKSNAAPVADAHKQVQIQGERLRAGKAPAATSARIAELDFIWGSADDLAKFLTFE